MANEDLKEAVELFYDGLKTLKSQDKTYHTTRFNANEHIIEIFQADYSEMKRIIKVDEDTQVDAYNAAAREIGRFLAIKKYREERT